MLLINSNRRHQFLKFFKNYLKLMFFYAINLRLLLKNSDFLIVLKIQFQL